MSPKVWFITGTSCGFGRLWTIAALRRGDCVAATARNLVGMGDLLELYPDTMLPLQLDVTDRGATLAAVNEAHRHFGGLDVVVNNAEHGQFGCVEEVSEHDVRAQFDTNVFGALWVTQAALPFLRKQGRGHILQISSICGLFSYPNVGMYNASKWALEGFSEALAQEVSGTDIRITIIKPGLFNTDWFASARLPDPLRDYYEACEQFDEISRGLTARIGDAQATAEALLAVIDAPDTPLRVDLTSWIVRELYTKDVSAAGNNGNTLRLRHEAEGDQRHHRGN